MNKTIIDWQNKWNLLDDFTKDDIEIIKSVEQYTMTTPVRIYSLIQAVKYIIKNNIEGDFVECGVWKGGSMMAVAYTLNKLKCRDRDLYLYDTFQGMEKPTVFDVNYLGDSALEIYNSKRGVDGHLDWAYATVSEVKNNMIKTGYFLKKIHFVEGKVERTIPKIIPKKISLLRLDTDFYASTIYELNHLYPKVQRGGIVIFDDYNHWLGSKKAVDEYFKNKSVFLSRVDYACRLMVKIK
jgi:hypothetical protein